MPTGAPAPTAADDTPTHWWRPLVRMVRRASPPSPTAPPTTVPAGADGADTGAWLWPPAGPAAHDRATMARPVVLPMPSAPLSWYVAGMTEGEALALASALTEWGAAGRRFLRCTQDRTRIYYLRAEDVVGVMCPLCQGEDFLPCEMAS